MRTKFAIPIVVFIIIFVIGVLGYTQANAATRTMTPLCWIDCPLDGSTLGKDTQCLIIAHSASPNGVAQTEFSINDKVLSTISNDGSSLVVSQQAWQPSAAGQFAIKARCRDTKGTWGDYAVAEVSVADTTPKPDTPSIIPPRFPLPLITVTGTSFSNMNLSTSHFYYRGTGCGTKQLSIQIKVADQAGIANVAIFFRLADQSSQKMTAWSSLPMQGIAGKNAVEGNWSREINSERDIPGFPSYTNSWFQFYFKAKNLAGTEEDSEIYMQKVALSACPTDLPPLIIPPFKSAP